MNYVLLLSLLWMNHIKAEVTPTREISIIVSKEGYYPKNFTVFQGEKVKFYVTSTVEDPSCLILQGHKVFLAATKGKIAEGETVFENPGTFAFYCPATKHDGVVTVIKKNETGRRGIASERDPQLWTPKEYE